MFTPSSELSFIPLAGKKEDLKQDIEIADSSDDNARRIEPSLRAESKTQRTKW